MSEAPEIIDYDKVLQEYKPFKVRLLGETHAINTFDGALLRKYNEFNRSVMADPTKTAHDAAAGAITLFLGIPVEDLEALDVRLLRRILGDILKACYRSGESEATKQPLDKQGS